MNRAKLAMSLGLIVASGAFGLSAFKKSLTPYVSFKDARASDGMVQVSGDVIRTKVMFDVRTGTLTFPLKDHTGQVMTVVSHDGKPNNFDRADKIVAIGHCESGVFQADHLLTKCPSKYKAEPGKAAPAPPNNDPSAMLQRASNPSPAKPAIAGG